MYVYMSSRISISIDLSYYIYAYIRVCVCFYVGLVNFVAIFRGCEHAAMGRLERLASFLLDPLRMDPPVPEVNLVSEPPTVEVACESSQHVLCKKRKIDRIEGSAACLVGGMHASHNAWRWRVEQCDRSLLAIPNLHAVMEKLNTSPHSCFDLRLPKARLASAVLKHCVTVIEGLASQGARFKIGITTDPGFRWSNPSFGYAHATEIYTTMVIVSILKTMEAAAYLEASLIREFRENKLCLNEALGGEGAMVDASPGFVYVVHTCFELI